MIFLVMFLIIGCASLNLDHKYKSGASEHVSYEMKLAMARDEDRIRQRRQDRYQREQDRQASLEFAKRYKAQQANKKQEANHTDEH